MGTLILPGIMILTKMPFVFGWAKPVPINPMNFKDPRKGMLWTALAGPSSNLALALISAVLFYIFYTFLLNALPGFVTWPVLKTLFYMVQINVVLAIFNLIPIPPLDGGRIMVGILPPALAYKWAQLEKYGIMILLIILIPIPMLNRSISSFVLFPVIKSIINLLLPLG
jgi:Zn-dependent protease